MEEIKSLATIEKSINEILDTAETLTVRDTESKLQTENILSVIRRQLRFIESERKSWTAPLEEQKKRLIEVFKNVAQPLVNLDCKLTLQLEDYRQKEEARIRREEEKLLARQEKLNERNPSPIPVIIAPSVAQPDKTSGGVTYIKKYKAYVINESEVPVLFGDVMLRPVDMVAINKLVSAGIKSIPGIEVREENELRVR